MERRSDHMVEYQLKRRGITHPDVLKAFKKVDRQYFVPEEYRSFSYDDHPLPIKGSQTISQPFIVALMSEALLPSKEKTVLEVGTGSGYQTAILAELFQHVYTVERVEELYHDAKETLTHLGYDNITFRHGDGKEGLIEHAPYDAILVTAAAKKLPDQLIKQMAEGARMVIPLGGAFAQELTVLTNKNGKLKEESLGGCRFVPLL